MRLHKVRALLESQELKEQKRKNGIRLLCPYCTVGHQDFEYTYLTPGGRARLGFTCGTDFFLEKGDIMESRRVACCFAGEQCSENVRNTRLGLVRKRLREVLKQKH